MKRMPLLKNTCVVRCECGCKRDVRTSLRWLKAGKHVFFEKSCNIRYNSEYPARL